MWVGQSAGRTRRIYATVLVAHVLFRLWFITMPPLSGDEAYHWEWSRHLAPGYYDHPGLTAYLIRCSTFLFGRSTEFTVRLPALLCLSLASIVCYALARRMARENEAGPSVAEAAGLCAGVLMLMVPVFAVFSVYISTDPPLLLFWPLSLYTGYVALTEGRRRQWVWFGVSLGFAMLSKFLAFFLFPAIGLFVLLSKPDRMWVRRPHGYVAAAIALLVFSPVLWWNATHGWATFVFNFLSRHRAAAWNPAHMVTLLVAFLITLSPGILCYAVWAMREAFAEGLRRRRRPALYLALSFSVPVAYFCVRGLTRHIGAHWPAAGCTGLLVYLGVWWARTWGELGRAKARLRVAALVVCVLFTGLLHVGVLFPLWLGSIHWTYREMPRRVTTELFREFFGWRELGRYVEAAHDEMLAGQGIDGRGVFVICNQYGLAASVAFYTPSQLQTRLWSRRRTHGENYRFWDDFPALSGQDAVFVTKRRVERCIPNLRRYFADVSEPDVLPILVNGSEVRRFFVVRCRKFNGSIPVL